MNDEKQPKIRFKGFEDPWEQRKFSDIAKRRSKQYERSGVPSVEFEDIVSDEGKLKDGFNTKETHKKGIFFKKSDTLFGKLRPYLHNWLFTTFDGIAVGDFWVLYTQKCDSLFLYYLIQSETFQSTANISTGTKMPRSDWKLVSETLFYIPLDKNEQISIGYFFGNIDKIIAANQSKLDQFKELKKLLMEKIFSQQWRFKGFTDPWEQRKLGEIVEINSGRDYKKLGRGKIPVFGTGGYMLSVNGKLSDRDSVGIGRKGSIDKPQFLSAPFWTVDTLFFMTPKNKNDVKFIFDLSQLIQWKKYDESTGVPSLSKSTISNIPITVTKEDEQNKVSTLFELVDKLIAANQRRLDQLKALKKYLMQNMFV